MSRTRIAAHVAGAVALVLLAGVLALLGRDVLAWRGQTARTDVAIAHFSRRPVGEPDTWLPVALSRTVLAASDDVRVARALQGVQRLRVAGDPNRFDPPALQLAKLELTFDEIADGSGPAAIRSRARQLHALLLFQQLVLQAGSGSASATRGSPRSGERGSPVRPRDAAPDLQADRHRDRRRARVSADESRNHRRRRRQPRRD